MSTAMTANGGGLVAAEIEARGLIDAELCFGLTSRGRARLAVLDTDGRAER